MPDEPTAPDTVIVEVNTGDQSSEIETPDPTPEPPTVVVVEAPPAPVGEYIPELDPMLQVNNRFEILERRMDAAEAELITHASDIAGRAEAGHSHPLPSTLEALNENLEQVEKEEIAPKTGGGLKGFLNKRIF